MSDEKKFELKPEHIKLAERMYVGWNDCEFGAPEIDPKRPYGNGDVHQDMLEILGLETVKDGIYKFQLGEREWLLKGEDEFNIYIIDGADEEALIDELDKLHQEMQTALQVILSTKTFEPGTYEAEPYSSTWKRVI